MPPESCPPSCREGGSVGCVMPAPRSGGCCIASSDDYTDYNDVHTYIYTHWKVHSYHPCSSCVGVVNVYVYFLSPAPVERRLLQVQ